MKYHADIATIMTTTLGSAVQVTTIQVASHAVRLGGWFYSIVLSWLQIQIHGIYYTIRIQMAQVHTVLLHVEYYSLSVVIMYMLAFYWLIWMKQEHNTLVHMWTITFPADCKPITYVRDRI